MVNILVGYRKPDYLGYEKEMSKVVAEFDVSYRNGEVKKYKKYFYLIEENNHWKIIFEKTFIGLYMGYFMDLLCKNNGCFLGS